ncbi:hypothetical protein [Ammoniphilus resinae]|uniref:Phosphoglyceromutase n=1 Tax=Ammoniphilus resinae TaxID=861532 RepID=A0ABS4GIG3_9BACL|nr:hypothetical protein [Ammoniphilus resinae]MBP1930045.1 hypothetical protein [Ammoniphilus resinae]
MMFFPHSISVEAENEKKVLIVLANQVSLDDLRQMQSLHLGEWIERGLLAAMNIKTAGSMTDINNLVTLGSGTRAVGSEKALASYSGEEDVDGLLAFQLYQQVTGYQGTAEGIYVPGIPYLIRGNENQPYPIIPGLLGRELHKNGLKTAVLGNSDKGMEDWTRFAPLFVMDEKGKVDYGDVSKATLRISIDSPYSVQTDQQMMLEQTMLLKEKADVIVLELGDLYRLYSMKPAILEEHFADTKTEVLQRINELMTSVVDEQKEGELILFVSPMVNEDAANEKSLMAPLLLITPEQQQGVLTSTTTRQVGIVGNVDVAPTVLAWLGLPSPPEMMGRPIISAAEKASFWNEWERIKHIYATRSQVLYGYISYQVAVLIFATALWLFAKPQSMLYQFANQGTRFLLLVLTLTPFILLILPWFSTIQNVNLTILFLWVLGTAISAAFIRLPFAWVFLLISLVNWVPILVDGIFLQSMLMKRSYLGYDPIIGARYYGIGNEYMGVVIGSSILSLAMLLEITKRKLNLLKGLSVTVFGLYLIFFALPKWGTNAGGALTAITAYCTSFFRLFDIQLNRKYVFWGGLAIVISFVTLFAVNLVGDDQSKSHIGRAMSKLFSGDFQEISYIIKRKLEMNVKLIQVSSWSKVFITSLLVLGVLCYRPAGVFGHLSERYPYAVRGFFGIIVGAFTALAVNDSGIVAAATTIVFMVVPLLYLGLQEKA